MVELLARAVAVAALAAVGAQREARDPLDQFGADRHRQFGGGGRGRRAQVGGIVAQRRVGLVPDRGDQRDRAARDRAHDRFLVERPQILDRAAAARDDDRSGRGIGPPGASRIEAADRGGNLGRGAVALHLDRPDQHPGRAAILQPVDDVADHRPGRRGHHPDHRRHERQRARGASTWRTAPRRRAAPSAARTAPSARLRPPARGSRSRSGIWSGRDRW